MKCQLCPRRCGARRDEGEYGYCGAGSEIVIARAAPHMWEEPSISGTRGSGAIFFSGCPMHCVFCQNSEISRKPANAGNDGRSGDISPRGVAVSEERLGEIMFSLKDMGVHNINLVTPTHYSDRIARVLRRVRDTLGLPIVYNCGGYESVDALKELDGLVDIYLPDFKYFSPELSARYSSALDYAEVASAALSEMYRQVGRCAFDADGIMTRGMIVRHLVLPGARRDSIDALRHIAGILPVGDIRISVMRQFTPDFVADRDKYPELCRRLTTFEYESVLAEAGRLGFDGYSQGADSASGGFTPAFDGEGV